MEAPTIRYQTRDNILYNIIEGVEYVIRYKKGRYLYIDDIYTFNRIKSDWKRHNEDGHILYILSNIDRKYQSGTYHMKKRHLRITQNTQWKNVNRRTAQIEEVKTEVLPEPIIPHVETEEDIKSLLLDRINKMSIDHLRTAKKQIDKQICKLTGVIKGTTHMKPLKCIDDKCDIVHVDSPKVHIANVIYNKPLPTIPYVQPIKKINIPIYKPMSRDDAMLDINLRRIHIHSHNQI